jgi:hypothetical protein
MGEDLSFFLADVGVVLVLCLVLYGVRRAIQNQAWRDFLGVSMTFVVLAGVGFVMIIGEHYLG